MLVIDASAAIAAVLAPNRFGRIVRREPIAPPLLWSEAISAIRQALWRRELQPDSADEAVRRFMDAPIQRRSPNRLYFEAWAVARELGWAKTYDAEYVALARIFQCPLLTQDGKLKRGASHVVDVIGPTEL